MPFKNPFRKKKKSKDKRDKIRLQFYEGYPEGGRPDLDINTFQTYSKIPGTVNRYLTYRSKVYASYQKYNGAADYGCPQFQAAANFRAGVIAGEKLSFSSSEEFAEDWLEDYLDKNRLKTTRFFNAVLGGELAGQVLFRLSVIKDAYSGEPFIGVTRIPYNIDNPFKPIYPGDDPDEKPVLIEFTDGEGEKHMEPYDNYVYLKLYGDDKIGDPVTVVGEILEEVENYDRSLKDMRRLNHTGSRITPVFETTSKEETNALIKMLKKIGWKIGQAFVGTSKFRYETPDTKPLDNLTKEQTSIAKILSVVTGLPMHWLGNVEMMSNRATSKDLYEMIKQNTAIVREKWADGVKELIIKSQALYINNGGSSFRQLTHSLQVKLPLIDFSEFVSRVQALSIAYQDGALSMFDYRNGLPGIDPVKTAKQIATEKVKGL